MTAPRLEGVDDLNRVLMEEDQDDEDGDRLARAPGSGAPDGGDPPDA